MSTILYLHCSLTTPCGHLSCCSWPSLDFRWQVRQRLKKQHNGLRYQSDRFGHCARKRFHITDLLWYFRFCKGSNCCARPVVRKRAFDVLNGCSFLCCLSLNPPILRLCLRPCFLSILKQFDSLATLFWFVRIVQAFCTLLFQLAQLIYSREVWMASTTTRRPWIRWTATDSSKIRNSRAIIHFMLLWE
jgi:hypothetical protein